MLPFGAVTQFLSAAVSTCVSFRLHVLRVLKVLMEQSAAAGLTTLMIMITTTAMMVKVNTNAETVEWIARGEDEGPSEGEDLDEDEDEDEDMAVCGGRLKLLSCCCCCGCSTGFWVTCEKVCHENGHVNATPGRGAVSRERESGGVVEGEELRVKKG